MTPEKAPINTVLCTCDDSRMILVFELPVPDPYDYAAIADACHARRCAEADADMPTVTPSLVLAAPLQIRRDFR